MKNARKVFFLILGSILILAPFFYFNGVKAGDGEAIAPQLTIVTEKDLAVPSSSIATSVTVYFTVDIPAAVSFFKDNTQDGSGNYSSLGKNNKTFRDLSIGKHVLTFKVCDPDPLTIHSKTCGNDVVLNYEVSDPTASLVTVTPETTNIKANSATVVWATTEESNSRVSYGKVNTAGGRNFSLIDATLTKNHQINLTSLEANTTYYFEVTSIKSGGASVYASGFGSFKTLSADSNTTESCVNADYAISGRVEDKKTTSATLTFTTSKNAFSYVDYNVNTIQSDNNKILGTITLTSGVYSHTISFTNLKSNTIYAYHVHTGETAAANKCKTADFTFTTLSSDATTIIYTWNYSAWSPLTCTGVTKRTRTATSCKDSAGLVATNDKCGTPVLEEACATGSGVEDNLDYSVTSIKSEVLTNNSAKITFNTTIDTTTLIDCDPSVNNKGNIDKVLKKTHSLTLTDLSTGTKYVCHIHTGKLTNNEIDNEYKSADFSFTTTGTKIVTPTVTYAWTTNWSTCASGKQISSYVCKNNSGATVAANLCGTKPAEEVKTCDATVTYSWVLVNNWSSCANGVKTKTYECKNSSTGALATAATLCTATKPADTTETCGTENQTPNLQAVGFEFYNADTLVELTTDPEINKPFLALPNIKNSQGKVSEQFWFKVFLDDKLISMGLNTNVLDPNSYQILGGSNKWLFDKAEIHKFKLVVDSENQIAESSETDNTFEKIIDFSIKQNTDTGISDYFLDTDDDGLTDYQESLYGTDKTKADTDGEGYDDLIEIQNGYSPIVAGSIKDAGRMTKAIYNKLIPVSAENKILATNNLKMELKKLNNDNSITLSAVYWEIYIKAFIYGGYTPTEIFKNIKKGNSLVHPTIEAVLWRER